VDRRTAGLRVPPKAARAAGRQPSRVSCRGCCRGLLAWDLDEGQGGDRRRLGERAPPGPRRRPVRRRAPRGQPGRMPRSHPGASALREGRARRDEDRVARWSAEPTQVRPVRPVRPTRRPGPGGLAQDAQWAPAAQAPPERWARRETGRLRTDRRLRRGR